MSGYQLAHHGIKGMRWGIRRYQPYPKGKHGKFLGQDRDEDIRIKKDTEAYRVQAKKDMTGDGSTYVSFDKLSNVKYVRASLDPDMGVAVDTYLEPIMEDHDLTITLSPKKVGKYILEVTVNVANETIIRKLPVYVRE